MSLKSVFKKILKPTKIKIVGAVAFLALAGGIGASVVSNASATGSCNQPDPTNDVIYCGINGIGSSSAQGSLIYDFKNGDGVNTGKSIQDIYSWYNNGSGGTINAGDINGMTTDAYGGYVTKSGDVYLNNTSNPAYPGGLVATGAITGGRHDIGGSASTEHIINGTEFWSRPPSVSFLQDSLSAFVVMKNNVFQFAILTSCGNAVKATPVTPTPPKVPNYTITKDVSYQGKGWVHQVTSPVGGVVQYKIDVTSTGTAPVTHVFVNDAISANIQYVPNTLKINGNPVGDVSTQDFFNKGLQIAGLNPGESTEISFNAKVGVLYTNDNCKPGPYINNAFVNASGLPQKGANAYVEEKCSPPPPPAENLVCSDLVPYPGQADSEGNTPYRFVGSATPTNAKITSYTFVINNSTTGAPVYTKTIRGGGTRVPFNYTLAPGQYDANLTVTGVGNDGKAFTNITSADCALHITVSTSPVCTAPNGSTYPVGSPQCTPSPTCTAPNGTTYPQGSPQCTPATCTTPSGQVVPAGSSACVPGSTCTTSAGQTFPAGSTECNTVPTALVNTGPGDVIALFSAATVAGALGHWYLSYRRAHRAF